MGQTLTGGVSFEGFAPKYTPQEQQRLNQLIDQNLPMLQKVLGGRLAGLGSPEAQTQFEAQFLNPALQNYEQQVLPQIQERFSDLGAGSSSALNQALASSAQNLQTDLYGQFAQQQFQGQSEAMSTLMQLISNPQFEAMIMNNPGVLGDIIGALGQIGASGVKAAF